MFGSSQPKKTRVKTGMAENQTPSDPRRSYPDDLAATTAPISATPAGKSKTSWMKSIFGFFMKKKAEEKPRASQENNAASNAKKPTKPAKKKTSWWPFKMCTDCCPVVPASEEIKTDSSYPAERCPVYLFATSSVEDKVRQKLDNQKRGKDKDKLDRQEPSTSVPKLKKAVTFKPELAETFHISDDPSSSDCFNYDVINMHLLIENLLNDLPSKNKRKCFRSSNNANAVRSDRFGFPNVGMTCYMNSTLQSLLVLEDFVGSVGRTEPVWGRHPSAQLLRRLADIKDCHTSTDLMRKRRCLRSFKDAVALAAPDFRDWDQKDAHEFLTVVLDQIRTLSPVLREAASSSGRTYTCPVADHLLFTMENTRTCKRCGVQSKTTEEFTNLSLDLVCRGSIDAMLQKYLMGDDLEFHCSCGGKKSSRRSAFATLPKVLVLHLKRFYVTRCFRLKKLKDSVRLQRDIVVTSTQGGACYSLVSIISHYGGTLRGHYISDGVHLDNCPDNKADRWLTFDDSAVSETDGLTVCKQRKKSAYILFYQKHD